jgi:imidazolonepropionase-like amidohydrolase
VLIGFGTDCGAELMVHGQQYKALYGESTIGSTPMESIIMATRDAARLIGRGSDPGTIEPGKVADLLILDANPLADLRNLRTIRLVMKAGVVYRTSLGTSY